jgi:hypothetical protein
VPEKSQLQPDYVLLVATTVVFWNLIKTGQSDFQDSVNIAHEPDFFLQMGMVLFGPPSS